MSMIEETDEKPSRAKRGGLFVTDAELIERLQVPEKIARQAIEMLDRDPASGFPEKQPLWGKRRYWPAIEEWLAVRNRLKIGASKRRESDAR